MFQPDLLKDKVILITGGGSGLGREMATRFLELGAKVAISSRRKELIEEAAREMAEKTGGQTFATPCDIRDPAQVTAMVDAVIDHFGRIDVLVNNAAGNFISPTERLSHRAVDAVLNIVLHGTFYCSLEVGKRWIAAQQPGVMLNIVATYASSGSGSGYVVPSAVAKNGVLALTRSLATEWGKYNIRQVAIAPGPFPTPGASQRLNPGAEFSAFTLERIPLKRYGKMDELTNLASFLISDGAEYITGEVVTIDGGEWLNGAGEFNSLEKVPADQWDIIAEKTRGKK